MLCTILRRTAYFAPRPSTRQAAEGKPPQRTRRKCLRHRDLFDHARWGGLARWLLFPPVVREVQKGGRSMFGLRPWRRGEMARSGSSENPFEMIRREFGNLFDRFFGAWPTENGWG